MAQDDDLFTSLSPGSFDGIVIPVQRVTIRTGSAAAFHKFPYRPGQRVEYTGREPITGSITAAFFNGVEEEGLSHDLLWPDGLQRLRNRVQEQKSGPLVLPPLGLLPLAYVTLSETYEPEAREGALVTLQFEEDSEEQFASGLKLPSARGRMDAAAASLAALSASAFTSLGGVDEQGNFISDLSAFIANIGGNMDRFRDEISTPVSQVAGLVRRIDDLLTTATSPWRSAENWPVRNALLDLKDAAASAAAELRTTSRRITTFYVAGPSNLAAVAAATGNSVTELLTLNALADGNKLAAGDAILVYDTVNG